MWLVKALGWIFLQGRNMKWWGWERPEKERRTVYSRLARSFEIDLLFPAASRRWTLAMGERRRYRLESAQQGRHCPE
jgi:hypothetical protein